jgi:hypothetical protein
MSTLPRPPIRRVRSQSDAIRRVCSQCRTLDAARRAGCASKSLILIARFTTWIIQSYASCRRAASSMGLTPPFDGAILIPICSSGILFHVQRCLSRVDLSARPKLRGITGRLRREPGNGSPYVSSLHEPPAFKQAAATHMSSQNISGIPEIEIPESARVSGRVGLSCSV